jgi:hypothetical protein
MARRSILSSVRDGQPPSAKQAEPAPETALKQASSVKPSRHAKLHIGGYYDPDEPTIVAFQKLGIDLRKSQQEMLLEALRDFVAKHEAAKAFS